MDAKKRNKEIIKYNLIGIVMNFVLSVMKIIIGLATDSHAVMLDGVNGFSDMK